ncbi:MAG: hypothetical protein GF307_03275 [candidate division Zixibacteria bacterium]|nr:hypothetical protein [candidate division Zixibacteria bacterium]
MIKNYLNITLVFLSLFCMARYAHAGWSIDLESGLAVSGYNDVRIPGDTGTEFSLSEDLDAENTAFIRARLNWDIGNRHTISLLAAPLRINSSGSLDRDINYFGVQFPAGTNLDAKYRFDSYRITYRYTIFQSEKFKAGIGLTAKIRDASIKVEGGGESSEKSNTGFVPLINFAVDWRFDSKLGLEFKGDALAAPQGRAEDILLALYGIPAEKIRIRVGYRILEGGADNDEVYNFALVNYLSAGITIAF